MFTNNFFNILLNLDKNWQVTNVESDLETNEITLVVDYINKLAKFPKTSDYFKIYDHTKIRKWRHLDTMQYKTFIECRLPRVKNKSGKIATILPPWASSHSHHTHLFEHAVIDLLLATKNQTKTAELMRCSFKIINKIIHDSTIRGLSRRDESEFNNIKHLSIDEKSFKRNHKYITVLSDPISGNIIDVEEDRTKESVTKLLDKTFTSEQQENVETISMDMWKAYLSVAKKKLINAAIVHDRFHLVQYLNKVIDKVRRREVKTNDELKNSRYTLLKNECNLTDKQKIQFETIKAGNYEVSKAWEVCANFKALFRKETDKDKGLKLYNHWVKDAYGRQISEVDKVVEMFDNHIIGVVNALISKFNNAMAERLNGKIQEIKTAGRGYRTFKNFRSVILFFHGGLELYPLKR